MSQPTLDQRRARHAWESVQAAARKYITTNNGTKSVTDEGKKYAIHARKLPTRILAAGLGHALAFLVAKGYAPDLLTALADWVLEKRHRPAGGGAPPQPQALRDAVVAGTADTLRRHTDEALAYLQWLNRFVEAEFPAEGGA
jgi:CRISPR-associated protein Cmr5